MSIALSKQVGLSRARRLAQGQSIKIQLFAKFPVQIDGEPWFQQPCTISIAHHGQVLCITDSAPPTFVYHHLLYISVIILTSHYFYNLNFNMFAILYKLAGICLPILMIIIMKMPSAAEIQHFLYLRKCLMLLRKF